MKTILVTGATGNVGRQVVEQCRARGLNVREASRLTRNEAPSAARAHLDFRDRRTWGPALVGCQSVFLLRPPAVSDMQTTLNPFIDAAYEAGVGHIVFLSVMGAERRSWVPHHAVEAHLRAARGSWTILRPGFFAQNLQDAYRRDIIEDGRVYVPAGNGKVAFLDVLDVGDACARIFRATRDFSGRTYTLTGPQTYEFSDVARILTEAVGRPIRYVRASAPGYLWHLVRRRGLPLTQAAIQTFLHWGLRRGDAKAVTDDVVQLLGRSAGTLEGYVARNVEQWMV